MPSIRVTVDGVPYDYDPKTLTNDEAMAIEKVTGGTYAQWGQALTNGSALATTAMVWILRRRNEPALRFDDVHFAIEAMETEVVPDPPTEAADSPSPVAEPSTSDSLPSTSTSDPGNGGS